MNRYYQAARQARRASNSRLNVIFIVAAILISVVGGLWTYHELLVKPQLEEPRRVIIVPDRGW